METRKNSYLKVFLAAFICFALIITPLVIYNKGYITYYGDFNSQQLPFYYHTGNAIKNGNFMWDWGTDLGSDLIISYSFYFLGSPFFWITELFPGKAVLYLMPWLLCLKYSLAALTSYAYIKRFTKTDEAAFTGCFLYAFSGFQMYNIFFNHFHDVTAFFPLLLLALEENITNDKKGFFAVTAAFMAIINFFFFAGQIVFLLIYFIIRCRCSDFKVTPKKFLILAAESVIGTGIAAIILLPTALSILNNYRVSEYLYGTDMIAYSESTRIWRIVQSFFMMPDLPARPNLFSNGTYRWSSIAGYLPMFSMIGVISFLRNRPDDWRSVIVKVCMIFAFIPVLNSAFYMFNAEYYARWYYMPVLIMSLITVTVLEDKDISPSSGIRGCIIFFAAVIAISVLPSKEDDQVKWFSFGADKLSLYVFTGVTVLLFVPAVMLFSRRKKQLPYLKRAVNLTMAACLISTCVYFWFGISIGPYPHEFISSSIESSPCIEDDDTFFRVDISENCDNYPMFWNLPSMRCFHSVVSPSIMEFYDSIGIKRDVASRAEPSYYALRGLLSVKYYFSSADSNGNDETPLTIPGFTLIGNQKNFNVYKNENFIPMGFTYDYYLSEERFSSLTSVQKCASLLKAVVLTEEQAEKFSGILKSADSMPAENFSRTTYENYCRELQQTACTNFTYSTYGFSADIVTDTDRLVFFSVPYTKGFTAYVNGKETDIEKVSGGFMAVPVSSGNSKIEFRYFTYGLKEGIIISAASITLLIIYIAAVSHCGKKKTVSSVSTENTDRTEENTDAS